MNKRLEGKRLRGIMLLAPCRSGGGFVARSLAAPAGAPSTLPSARRYGTPRAPSGARVKGGTCAAGGYP